MSRKFALLAAVCAFGAVLGAAPGAFAQAQSDMIPPGAPLPGGSTRAPAMSDGALSPAGRTAVGGSASSSMARPMHRGSRQAMRPMRRDRSASRAQGSDAAYMGGGAVYERGADGSLRPAM
ncbi:hypothetical protein [Roseomonas indoligenes]|uniref:Translation initiation factor IF-2 n=1 Tax=Roseomonas indoligenes TaxID=2820811 RepID=A0A940S7H0_9PROT|nr:hypothetical protein [Pararoseomonas indoligenes]MBP0493063.1 hypothetical protein [Pararoseomonas indoligenes]